MKDKAPSTASIQNIEDLTAVRVVRSALTSMIPILIIGAFSLILQTFPLKPYQDAIAVFAGGFFLELFQIVYSATFGVLSVYMTFLISRSYMKLKSEVYVVVRGASLASLLAFFILAGAYLPDFGTDCMGPKSMFLAILSGMGASALYLKFYLFFGNRRAQLFSSGADRDFNRMLSTLFPIMLVALCFGLFNTLVVRIFNVDSSRMLLSQAFDSLFAIGAPGFFKGFFFVLLSSVLWFFGIHGSDTLEGVMQTYFAPGLAANQTAIASGAAPTTVLTKEFFDCFVLMGGCGATICLLIAILLFSNDRARRGLGLAAAFPMLFNINELMVFGLPIIFNPIMLVPFLTVPLVCYSVSYLAISSGLVPMITSEVAWTTPILLGGYTATGSVAGSLLQLFNVAVGVLIYFPFVRRLDVTTAATRRRTFDSFITWFRSNEASFANERLTDRGDLYGDFAKGLCADLKYSMDKSVRLAYQPQYHYDGRCVGAEALLRWEHPVYGMLYPPLVIKLAEEGGFLPALEEAVFTRAMADRPAALERFGEDIKLSLNVTGTTVVTPRFLQFLKQENARETFMGRNICIEVTEQAALAINEETRSALKAMKDMGIRLAIDDFSMGQTSLHYIKDNLFDIIKLDGSLVRELFVHENSLEIIASICRLAGSLGMTVLAEYVETEQDRDALHESGCDLYQGYLYSPAVLLNKDAE